VRRPLAGARPPVEATCTAFSQRMVGRLDALLEDVQQAGASTGDASAMPATCRPRWHTRAPAWLRARARFAARSAADLRSHATGWVRIRGRQGRAFVGVGAALDRFGRTYPGRGLNSAFDRQPDRTSLA
jgi:hypothetical protein